MGDEVRSWVELRIGVTDDEAINFLEQLATNEENLRDRFEKDPGEVFRELKIDFLPGKEPQNVQLPDPDKLLEYVRELRATKADSPYTVPLSHGYIVLLVSHGSPPPPPPPPPES